MKKESRSRKQNFLPLAAIVVFITVAVAIVMFLVLRIDYGNVKKDSAAMLEVEKETTALLEMNKISKKDLTKVEQGLSAIGALKTGSERIESSKAAKRDYIVKEYADKISQKTRGWVELGDAGQVLLKLAQGDDNNGLDVITEELKKSSNKQLKKMGEELADYQKDVNVFKKKYGNGKAANYAEMQKEYGMIVAKGEEIKAKYEKMDIKKYVGLDKKSLIGLFDDLRALQKYLEEKN